MEKTWYNVNVNGYRVEQFETLEQAQEYLNKQIKPFITKSIYKYDNECDEWYETTETGIKG